MSSAAYDHHLVISHSLVSHLSWEVLCPKYETHSTSSSPCRLASLPECVLYTEYVVTTRPYIRSVSAVSAEWADEVRALADRHIADGAAKAPSATAVSTDRWAAEVLGNEIKADVSCNDGKDSVDERNDYKNDENTRRKNGEVCSTVHSLFTPLCASVWPPRKIEAPEGIDCFRSNSSRITPQTTDEEKMNGIIFVVWCVQFKFIHRRGVILEPGNNRMKIGVTSTCSRCWSWCVRPLGWISPDPLAFTNKTVTWFRRISFLFFFVTWLVCAWMDGYTSTSLFLCPALDNILRF